MGRRYSDIRRAAKLQTALDNYIQHLQTMGTRPSKIGQYGPRNLNTTAYVAPFTTTVAIGEVVAGKCTDDSYTTLSTAINGSSLAAVSDAIGADTLINIPKFRAARVIMFLNATRSVTVETSDVTGLQYLKYAGTRYSCPFGATADTDDQMDAFLDIKAALLAANSAADVCRVSLQREYIGVERT